MDSTESKPKIVMRIKTPAEREAHALQLEAQALQRGAESRARKQERDKRNYQKKGYFTGPHPKKPVKVTHQDGSIQYFDSVNSTAITLGYSTTTLRTILEGGNPKLRTKSPPPELKFEFYPLEDYLIEHPLRSVPYSCPICKQTFKFIKELTHARSYKHIANLKKLQDEKRIEDSCL